MNDKRWFTARPYREETCPRCRGDGQIDIPYALHHEEDPIEGAPEKAIRAVVLGSFDIFTACHEAVAVAKEAKRPVAFKFNDLVVVVRADDDPNKVARRWWFDTYKETPEETWRRR